MQKTLIASVGAIAAGMPDCATESACEAGCTCMESNCASLFSPCEADTQCNTLMNCLLGCSCTGLACKLGCIAGQTLDSVSSQVKTCAGACASSGDQFWEDFKTTGGVLDITYEDCGDASTHATINDVQPRSVNIGAANSLVATGTVDEAVSSGAFIMKVTAGGGIVKKTYTGDMCQPTEIDLPLNMGKMNWGGLACPVSGTMKIPIDVTLASVIPASLATADVSVTATANGGDKLACMNLHMAKQYAMDSADIVA